MIDFVLDASALLALLQGEPDADRVAAVLPSSVMSSVNLSEVASKLADKEMPAKLVQRTLSGLDLSVREFDEQMAYEAGALRSATAALGLSLGDRACLALAQRLKLPALTSDTSWRQLNIKSIKVEPIR
jgi:PIN domain nuclease of toxin-antitoxin system